MSELELIREQTSQEKKDFIDIWNPTKKNDLRISFRKKNVEMQQEATKQHKPYCYRCANLDFNDMLEDAIKEHMRRGKTQEETVNSSINFKMPELKDYAKENRFILLAETDCIEEKLIDRTRVPVRTGIWKKYSCKIRGCGLSVLVPIEEIEKGKK